MTSVWAIHDTQGWGSVKPSGCGFYRIILPFDQMKANGRHAGYSLDLPPEEFGDVDVFVAQRWDQPAALPMWESLGQAPNLARVYEMDDDPFVLDEVNWMATASYKGQDVLDSIARMAETADLVTVTTDALADAFRKFNPNVVAIPNYIPADMLAIQRPRHEKVTVGYAGGSSHMRDIATIAQPWRDVIDETGARGHFVGVDFRNILRPHGFDYTYWESDPRAYFRRIDFDVGLAPLSDHPFNLRKTPIKALEYAALGIPVVASDHPVYRGFVRDGETGLLCRTKQEWREALRALIASESLREEMGAKAKALAAEWTIEENWRRWDDAYRALDEERRHGRR